MSSPSVPQTEAALATILGRHPTSSSSLIPVLQECNREFGYLTEDVLRRVSERLEVPLAEVFHVVTFYKTLSLKPKGRHTIRVCLGTACHVRGAPRILDEVSRLLKVGPGETTADGQFTLETVNCLGACALGPVVVVNERYYQASPGALPKLLKAAATGAPEAAADVGLRETEPVDVTRLVKQPVGIVVCGGTGCQAYGCEAVARQFETELARRGIRDKVDFVQSGCHGFCERGPIVIIHPERIFYQKVTVEAVSEIIDKTVLKGVVVKRLLYRQVAGQIPVTYAEEIPFYAKQRRLVFGDNALISPRDIEHYIRRCHGYEALAAALSRSPEAIVDEMTRAGLRGRGGGGFPTGRKWASCRQAQGSPKYIICNADEGDPGAYMDRSLLEGNPHRVIEGMLIGAYAVGAAHGYVYVRDEYPLAVRNIQLAVAQARERGFLGRNILGSGLAFDLQVVRGGGAFVCGEETALMASLEGHAGEARPKYILPVEKGIDGKPTVINNVETWATVPLIIRQGSEWFAAIGTATSKGTKIFSLVGKVVNTGLVEVPMGLTLRELIFDIGGGIPGGKRFKAVQTGGPSGGCLPEAMLDTSIGFDELLQAGSMMGSGGVIVMDETSCMVDVARYFLHFLRDESCGKCVPCREGIARMLDILNGICRGEGTSADLDLLRQTARVTADASLCALGGTAPNPVLSTLKYFADEYRAHIEEHRCPAKVCKALLHYRILAEKCTGCTACAKRCPVKVISGKRKQVHVIDTSGCIKCGACLDACKFDAVEVL